MECPYVPSVGYGEFRDRLHLQVAGQRIPLSGSLEVTFRCNLRCRHCWVAHGHAGIAGKTELSLDEIDRILGEAADEGCLWLLLTGGEPLVRRDFPEIWTRAKRRGLLLTLFTNGTLLSPALADALAEYPPFNLEITLYGATQGTYERVTGIPGSHRRCMHGIELLRERGIPFRLKTMVLTLNRHELAEMQTFAESLGVEFRYDPVVNAGADGSSDPLVVRLSPREVIEVENADGRRVGEWRSLYERMRPVPRDRRYLYACGAGLQAFHIDPYGELSICMMTRHVAYDLRRGSFRQGWREELARERFRAPEGPYPCGECRLLPICGQCPGWAIIESGQAQEPVAHLCQVAHLRAEAFGLS